MNKILTKANTVILETMLISWIEASIHYNGSLEIFKSIRDFIVHYKLDNNKHRYLYQIYYRYVLEIKGVPTDEKNFNKEISEKVHN